MDLREELARKTLLAQQDRRSVARLIGQALDNADGEAAERALEVLRFRATREVLEAAQELATSGNPQERMLAADILGQLGIPERVFPGEATATLLEMLEREQVPFVLSDVAIALGHQRSEAAVEPLARLRQHPDAGLRYAVVQGLLGQESDLAIETLIELSDDVDPDVRDWATFGLGTMITNDTPQLREVLLHKIADENPTVRGEALVGLAIRHDERVITPLIQALQSVTVGMLELEAARELGDPRLLPALYALAAELPDDPDLAEAIESCLRGRDQELRARD